jgi:hypothetical protein
MSTYGFEPAGGIVCSYMQNGNWHLARLDGKNGKLKEIPTSYRQIDHLRIGNGFAVFLGGSPAEPSGLIRLDLATGKSEILRQNSETIVPADCISEPQSIEFPTEGGLTAFAY